MIELRMTGLTAEGVRQVASALHRYRDDIPTYNNAGSIAPHWAPVIHCEGEFFTVFTPKIPSMCATALLAAVAAKRLHHEDGTPCAGATCAWIGMADHAAS